MKKTNNFNRRSFLITLINLLFFLIIGLRLFFLQILKGSEFQTLSKKNSLKLLFIEPKRGEILDGLGKEIAQNVSNFKLMIFKQREFDAFETLSKLQKIVKLNESAYNEIHKKIKHARLLSPVIVKESMDWNEVAKIESYSHNLPGIYIEKGYRRFYPHGNLYCHISGYMGYASKEQVTKFNLYHNKDFKVGKAGIERTKQAELMGQFGMKRVEVNAYRKVIRNLSEIPSTSGENIHLAINHDIQNFVSKSVKNRNAAVVILSAKTGGVLSMLSTPGFDPNLFTTGIDQNSWDNIINNPSHPLTNKTIGKLYPPGSVWKVIVAVAILESGISPFEKVNCQGFVKIGNHKFKCWHRLGHGPMDLDHAMMRSCNPYFYTMSQKIGIKKIHEVAAKFGFGKKTGVDLPGELQGINPSKGWKSKYLESEWMIGDTANASIGQGFILATPLQLANMTARLASGLQISPHVLKDHNSIFPKLDIKTEYLDIVRNAMIKTTNSQSGLGFNNRIREKKFRMAAKTGTAQVISRDTSRGNVAKNLKSHSVFIGFAPIHDPKYAAALIVDHGGWGSVTAAPIGRDILHFTQKTLSNS